MKSFFLNFLNDEQGQDLIEYTLLLAFVALVSAAGWLVVRTFARRPVWLTLAPAYVMGSLSALWCLERAALLVVGR